MNTVDLIIWIAGLAIGASFIYILWSYAKGLKACPREIWILFASKVIEYAAYGAMNVTFALFLSSDVGMSDIGAGSYIGAWSITLTVVMILVGAVVDAIGIKRTLLLGCSTLLIGRLFMPFFTNIYAVTLLGFVPLAAGTAIMGPVLSVGIKRYTTKESSALGFGLFYTLMNVGWATGAWIFDKVRTIMGEHGHTNFLGFEISTYQTIFLVTLFLTIPNFIIFLFMRNGVELTEEGKVEIKPIIFDKAHGDNFIKVLLGVTKKAAKDTLEIFRGVIKEKSFWYFILMMLVIVFVRLIFYHFHYTFPKYGIRVLGEGIKIGSLYGMLNPIIIIFLVPFMSALTKKVSSYKMMTIGTILSAFSVFIALMPAESMQWLMGTWVEELVFDRWLELAPELRNPYFFVLIFFIIIFTIGEAIWSPRLMQFMTEVAPKGKEGSYVSLSYLPYFAAKFVAGPMSGWLVATYTPEGAESYPNHYMVWLWIGGMAIITPLGLLFLKKVFTKNISEQ